VSLDFWRYPISPRTRRKCPRFFNFSLSAISSHPPSKNLLSRAGFAGYVTTIHLFSGDIINQNKLSWKRENRLRAPREVARRSRSLVTAPRCSFVGAWACLVCLGYIRMRVQYTPIHTNVGHYICSRPCVYNIGVRPRDSGCCTAERAEPVFVLSPRAGRLALYWRTCSVNPVQSLVLTQLLAASSL